MASSRGSAPQGWADRQKTKLTKIDLVLLAAYPFGTLGSVFAVMFVHSAKNGWATLDFIVLCILIAVLFSSPVLTILWVLLNRGQTSESVLWLESTLAGALAAVLIVSAVSDRLGVYGLRFLLLIVAIAIPIILAPHYSRNRRRSAKTA